MNDTPEKIKQLQLQIWLAKTPSERLVRFLKDNDDFFKMIESAKQSYHSLYNKGDEKTTAK